MLCAASGSELAGETVKMEQLPMAIRRMLDHSSYSYMGSCIQLHLAVRFVDVNRYSIFNLWWPACISNTCEKHATSLQFHAETVHTEAMVGTGPFTLK